MIGKERLYYFDVMKGIAITLVVIGHVMLFSFNVNPSEPSKFIYFNMPLFFYISGYLAYRQIDLIADLIQRLFKRGIVLLFPYAFFLILYHIFSESDNSIIELLTMGGGRYWFLYDLFIISSFFLIYGYLIRNIKKQYLYVFLWLIPFGVLMCLKLGLLNATGGEPIISRFVNYYRYYLIGYLCKKYIRLNDIIFYNKLVCAFGFTFYLLNWYFFDYHNMLLIFGGTLGGIIAIQQFVIYYVRENSKVGGQLILLGKCSLGIYVIHYFFIPDISNIVLPYIDCPNPFVWQLTLAFMVSIPIIVASVFVYKVIEMNKWLYFISFGKLFKLK